MKQFLIPKSNQEYTIAEDFTFLLYSFNLHYAGHPFKNLDFRFLYGKFDKNGNYKFNSTFLHGSSIDIHGSDENSYNSDEGLNLLKCFVLVDSEDEKNSKLIKPYNDKNNEWILRTVSKELTYCIYSGYINYINANNTYYIPYPEESNPIKETSFPKDIPNVITKAELHTLISEYEKVKNNTISLYNDMYNKVNSLYKIRLDAKIEQYIPIEYTLDKGTKFKFIKFEPKFIQSGNKKKFKNFVELEIQGHTVYLRQDDFSKIFIQ
jgi:hypothetical protein